MHDLSLERYWVTASTSNTSLSPYVELLEEVTMNLQNGHKLNGGHDTHTHIHMHALINFELHVTKALPLL